jgi:hypothetical protein
VGGSNPLPCGEQDGPVALSGALFVVPAFNVSIVCRASSAQPSARCEPLTQTG